MKWIPLALIVLVACVLAGSMLALGAMPQSATSSVSRADVPPALIVEATPTHVPACWVTGDLVGDANPAAVDRALCGER